MQRLLSKLHYWRPGQLAKGTLAATLGMGLRTGGQVVVFLLVARLLGVENYGVYAAVLALATAIGCFGGLGTQSIVVREISRNPGCFAEIWGRTIASLTITAPLLFLLYLALTWIALPTTIALDVVLSIGLAEIVFAPFMLSTITLYQGYERIGRVSKFMLLPILPRLLAALLLIGLSRLYSPEDLLSIWSLFYATSALLTSFYAWRLVKKEFGSVVKPTMAAVRRELIDGLPYAFGSASQRVYADIDKTMLARLDTLQGAGLYSAAYRVTDIALVPIRSLLLAAMPKVFRVGEDGVGTTLSYARRIIPIPLLYAFAAGVVLFLLADVLPWLLGPGYSGAVAALRWLAWLPLVTLPRVFLQTVLIGSDHQRGAVTILTAGALLNTALNIALIPSWSWLGAVIATYFSEVVMALVMLAFGMKLSGKWKRI